jgi:hypothetical protein
MVDFVSICHAGEFGWEKSELKISVESPLEIN